MDKDKLTQVAKTLMFEVNDQVLNTLAIEYDKLNEKINNLKKINIDNIKPLIYVDQRPSSYLREDILDHEQIFKSALKNAPQKNDNYIVLPRFVKDQKDFEHEKNFKKREQ